MLNSVLDEDKVIEEEPSTTTTTATATATTTTTTATATATATIVLQKFNARILYLAQCKIDGTRPGVLGFANE